MNTSQPSRAAARQLPLWPGLPAAQDRTAKARALLTGLASAGPAPVFSLGPDLDANLPEGGLREAGLHDIRPACHQDRPAALAFALALAARRVRHRAGVILWCAPPPGANDFGAPYAPGLAAFGLDPAQFVMAATRPGLETLWAMEESARTPGVAAVIGLAAKKDVTLTMSRRLAQASAAGGGAVLLLRAPDDDEAAAARSRWRIGAAAAPMGAHRFAASLLKIGAGAPRDLLIEWDHGAHRFRLPALLAGGARPAQASRRTARRAA